MEDETIARSKYCGCHFLMGYMCNITVPRRFYSVFLTGVQMSSDFLNLPNNLTKFFKDTDKTRRCVVFSFLL